MRNVFLLILILSLLSSQNIFAQDFQVTSFNIRYGTPGDGENKWKSRRDRVFHIFKKYREGIIATQEALPLQIDEILNEVSQLDVVFRSRTIEPRKAKAMRFSSTIRLGVSFKKKLSGFLTLPMNLLPKAGETLCLELLRK